MPAYLLPNGKQQFIDINGKPLVGGTVGMYVPDTLIFKNTWKNSGETVLNTNPIILDSRGQAIIYGVGTYRQIVKDAHGNLIWDEPTNAPGDSGLPFITPQMFDPRAGTPTFDATAAIRAALTAGSALGVDIFLPDGQYKVTPTTPILVDMATTGIRSLGGAFINDAGNTSGYVFQVYSTATFDTYQNNLMHEFGGFVLTGTALAGRHGVLVGHITDGFCSNLRLWNMSIQDFDRNLELTDNCWRLRVEHVQLENPVNYSVYIGTGLINFGEALQFEDVQFSNGSAANIVKFYAGTVCQIEWRGCSLLNQTISLDGLNMNATWYSGNMENPGSGLSYTFVELLADEVNFNLIGTSITLNFGFVGMADWTDPVFTTNDSSQSICFTDAKFPDVDPAIFHVEQVAGSRVWVSGPGRVVSQGSKYWPLGGGAKPPIALDNCVLINPLFATGDLTGWTATPFGAGVNTATVINTDSYLGTYCLECVTDVAGGINVTQKLPCSPNQYVSLGSMVKVVAPGGGPIGALQVIFLDADGNTLSMPGNPLTDTVGAWDYQDGVAVYSPLGTAFVVTQLDVQLGATVRFVNIGQSIG